MKLYYFQFGDGVENFGDNLNHWLWKRLLDGYLDSDDQSLFLGIGTLLNDQVALETSNALHRVVFSTGVGYGEHAPKLDESWRVYCVRGPLSAQALGLPMSAAVCDGAMMLALLDVPRPAKRCRYAFMPHIEQIADIAWRRVCRDAGFSYIDPRWPTETVLTAIAETEILVTEAMHGAIAADALRVPWIPVTTSPRVLAFKWHDFCQSIGLAYEPRRITTQVNPRQRKDMLTPAREVRYWAQHQAAQHDLARLTRVRPLLSSDATISRVVGELDARLEQFKADVDAGHFWTPSDSVERAWFIEQKQNAA